MYSCITCSNSISCNFCSSSSKRALSVNRPCDPLPGFFDNGTQLAPACVSPCDQCTSASACVTCVPGYFIFGSACNNCSSAMPNCLTCPNATACSSCQLGFIVNATTNLCSVVACYDLAAAFTALALVSGKMIGVEMMAVVQISFFSLITLSQLNPCFAALASLRLINGYNSLSKASFR